MPNETPERLVADTHALLWWLADRARLTPTARKALDGAASIAVASVSFWEVGMLASKGRVQLDRPIERWTNDLLASGEVVDVSMSATVAAAAATLDEFHGDPADRFIVATAQALGVPIVSKDRNIRNWARTSARLRVVW